MMSGYDYGALSVVERDKNEFGMVRWRFRLCNEDGNTVHLGDLQMNKLDAMADRDSFHRKAQNTPAEYRTPEQVVAMRSHYRTKDQHE